MWFAFILFNHRASLHPIFDVYAWFIRYALKPYFNIIIIACSGNFLLEKFCYLVVSFPTLSVSSTLLNLFQIFKQYSSHTMMCIVKEIIVALASHQSLYMFLGLPVFEEDISSFGTSCKKYEVTVLKEL